MTVVGGKPFYVKLHCVAPNTRDHNIVVKVISVRVLVDKQDDGDGVFHAHYMVGDDSGTILLDVHDRNVRSVLGVNSVVALHNVKAKVVRERLRLTMGKWSRVENTTRTIRGHLVTQPNFSETVYKQT